MINMKMSYRRLYKSFYYFLLLTLAALFWGAMNYVNVNVGGSGIQLPYNASAWLLAAIFIFFTVVFISIRGEIKVSRAFLAYLLCVALIFFPMTFNNLLLLDTMYLVFIGLFSGLIFLFSLMQFPVALFKRYFLMVLFISVAIQVVWGLIQYYWIVEPGVLFFRAVLGQPYGVFQQVNDYASYLAVGSMMAMYYLFRNKSDSKPWIVACALFLFASIHLMVLAKVTTMLVLTVVSCVLYLFYWNFKSKNILATSAIILSMMFAILIPREAFYLRPAEAAQQSAKIEQEKSQVHIEENALPVIDGQPVQKDGIDWSFLGTRQIIYPIAIEMIMDKPVTGHGVGSFGRKFLEYQAKHLQENPDIPAEFYLDHAHSEILQWMIELGVFSLVGFIALVIVWFYMARKGSLDLSLLLLALPLALHSLFELPFYHSAPHFLLFMGILFIADSSKIKKIRFPKLLSIALVPLAGYGLFSAFVFLFSTIYANLMFHKYYELGKKTLAPLLEIKNPAAFRKRYNYEFMQSIMIRANIDKELSYENAEKYIYWAYSVIQYAPQESVYENFVIVLRLYGNMEASLKYAKEAHYLYPRNTKFPKQIADLEKLMLENKADSISQEAKDGA